MFAGQSERDGIAEIDREGDGVMLGDQDSLTPFMHCLCQGGVHGFVELAFHACAVGCGDALRELNSFFHVDLAFLCGDCLLAFRGASARAADSMSNNLVED